MTDIIRRESIYLWYYFSVLFEQIFRFWALGTVIGSVISVFGKRKIHKMFEALNKKKLGIFGIIPASILGIASPICMYGTIPIAASFSEHGIKDEWLAAFMLSSILLNPQLIIYSAALGATVLTIRVVSCFLCGVTAGLCVRFFYAKKGKSFFNFSGFSEPENHDVHPNIFVRLLKNLWRNVKTTGPYFLLGLALAAAFQRYVPESVMVDIFGRNEAFGVLMAATVGVPLYACGGGTIPLLQGWLLGGMSIGSAAAFMITGPSTKLTNLGAVKIVLGARRFILYLLFAISFALVTGIIVDLIIRIAV
jgi:uncharacterized membrane protein YraQ (UPF0718 family)